MKTKKILLGTLLVLILSALYHDIYELFPNTITSFFFPIDESIWEHNKMILLAFITWAILEKISMKSSKNSLFKNLVACVTTIILVLTIFTPVFLFLLNKHDHLYCDRLHFERKDRSCRLSKTRISLIDRLRFISCNFCHHDLLSSEQYLVRRLYKNIQSTNTLDWPVEVHFSCIFDLFIVSFSDGKK